MFLSYLQDPQFFFLHCYMIAKLFSGSPNGKKLFVCSEDLQNFRNLEILFLARIVPKLSDLY